MTDLRKTIKRRTLDQCQSVRRRLVVALLPGDVIAFKEEGRRKWYSAPISRVFVQVVKWNADAVLAEKRRERKGRRAK